MMASEARAVMMCAAELEPSQAARAWACDQMYQMGAALWCGLVGLAS
jgi:hypothetical protein